LDVIKGDSYLVIFYLDFIVGMDNILSNLGLMLKLTLKLINKDKIRLAISLRSDFYQQILPVVKALLFEGTWKFAE